MTSTNFLDQILQRFNNNLNWVGYDQLNIKWATMREKIPILISDKNTGIRQRGEPRLRLVDRSDNTLDDIGKRPLWTRIVESC